MRCSPRARATYDVAICMYHDQALIPLKALDFDQGVNVTLGLPIIRTSPDHGTAFGIAGKHRRCGRHHRGHPHGGRMRRAPGASCNPRMKYPPAHPAPCGR
jgi:hypothetical protein